MARDIIAAQNTVTLAVIAAVGNSIKTSIATDNTGPHTYSGVALNGSLGGTLGLPRTVSVTTSSFAATYDTTDPIVIVGTDANGNTITNNLLLTAAGGGETVVSSNAFKTVTSITVPQQLTTSGAFTFGTKDIFPGREVLEMRVGTAGNLVLVYNNGNVDTIAASANEHLPYSPVIVKGTSTAAAVTFAFKD